jgi:hypothetical protein
VIPSFVIFLYFFTYQFLYSDAPSISPVINPKILPLSTAKAEPPELFVRFGGTHQRANFRAAILLSKE